MKSTAANREKKASAKKQIKKNSFPIVAIGASAGGLEAITELLKKLPPDTGMAFVYVQHLSPDHKSILTSILAKSTLMKVQEVTNKVLMKPNNFYVIPPNKEMAVLDGHIELTPRKKGRVVNLPINTFFCSLAEKHTEGAIGIILSGSASDGTRGLGAIKEAGGLTFAQDDSAKFSSMPRSAIAAGVVDFVLSPKEIAREIARLSKNAYVRQGVLRKDKENEIENNGPDLKIILNHLHKATGVDFSHYKMTTIKRRILRRMLLYKIKTLEEYTKLIGEKSDEINILYQDLLINVTGFFRDADAHQFLKTTLFPRILKSKSEGETLRIWIPACSSGEEAYSIAMTILEIQGSKATNIPVQIFATDLSTQAIAKARIGDYSVHDLESISPKRLQRFYTKSGSNYRVAKTVRDMCVFAPHNVLRDPPFSRIDFISCCNLLIYLDTAAQKKAISVFHYALNDGGYLMLGKSETIGTSNHLFTHAHDKFKIYSRKKNSDTRPLPELFPRLQHIPSGNAVDIPSKKNSNSKSLENTPVHTNALSSAIDSVLLSRCMPASVVINHDFEILEFRGSTDLYLRHSTGKASLNILKMTRPEIAFELRNIIQKAIKTKREARKSGIEVKIDSAVRMLSIEVIPVNLEREEPLLLTLFTEQEHVETYSNKSKGGKNNSTAKDRKIKKLEEELSAARVDMQSFAHEQEAINEELQSANEEVVSSNEELQSVNEELETSKEEIESANEELITTNQELQTRNELLAESYDYSEAIIATTHEPMIILDKDLRVKSANKSFYKEFGVKHEETEGMLLYDLGNKQWNIPRLRELLDNMVSKNSSLQNFEVTHTFPGIGEKIMLLNANRIVQKSHREQLILLAIEDITEHTLLELKEKEFLKKENLEGRSQNIKLEEAVKERTKQLERANETLEEKNRELQAFTYVSSHQLQEPIRKIQTFVSRLFEKETQNLSDKGRNYFHLISDEAQRMQQLIEDLLAFSRINKAEIKLENTKLATIVEEVETELKDTIQKKHATISATGLGEAKINRFQFRELMLNLISNSLKFSDPGKPLRIIIKSRISTGHKLNNNKLDPQENYCHIAVKDNGIGFEPQYSERIFEVFQKLHGKEEYPGTGIGLAIVKKIVENHNGIITATSELNKGAIFDIYIPTT